MRILLSFLLLAFMAGCATPVERCITQATEVYRDALKEQRALEATLARGYAIRQVRVPYQRFVVCETKDGKKYPCWRTYYRWVERKEQVNLAEVRRRSAEITARLPSLEAAAREDASDCRETFRDSES